MIATSGTNFSNISNGFKGGMSEGTKLIAYNASLAIKNLDSFKDSMDSVLAKLSNAFCKLMSELRDTWASPEAQRFYQKNMSFLNIITEGSSTGNSIISNTVLAVAEMARSNGSTFQYGGSISCPVPDVSTLLESIDGYSGINVERVKNTLMAFNTDINNALADLASVNDGIAVYDIHENIKTLFSEKIASLRSNINSAVEDINSDINNTIQTEELILNTARNKIISNLNAGISAAKSQLA